MHRGLEVSSTLRRWTQVNSGFLGLEDRLNVSRRLNSAHSEEKEAEFWSRQDAHYTLIQALFPPDPTFKVLYGPDPKLTEDIIKTSTI